MLGRSYALQWYISLCVDVVVGAVGGTMAALLAMACVREKLHILGPPVSRSLRMMGVPSELLIVASNFVNVMEQLASQNTPILRRLLANDGIMVQFVVPGGRFGRLVEAVADNFSNCPLAILMVVGAAL